jgi:hypothetical protein
MANPAMRDALGAKARAVRERYHPKIAAEQWASLFHQVISARSGHSPGRAAAFPVSLSGGDEAFTASSEQ